MSSDFLINLMIDYLFLYHYFLISLSTSLTIGSSNYFTSLNLEMLLTLSDIDLFYNFYTFSLLF